MVKTAWTGLSWSGTVGSAPPPERWLLAEHSFVPIARDRGVMRNRATGATIVITKPVHDLLGFVSGSCTLPQHAERIRSQIGPAAPPATEITALLQQVAAAGLLVDERSLVDAWRQVAPEHAPPPPLWAIVVRTCDRPALLARLLAACRDNEHRFGRHYRYVVLDDSQDAASRAANADAVRRAGLDAHLVDLASPTALERALRHAFPDALPMLQWLFGARADGAATYGRPLNIALLLAAGRRFLAIDDDALPTPRALPWAQPGLAFSAQRDEWAFHRSEQELLAALPRLAIDPFAAHEEKLGRRVGDVVGSSEPGAPLDLQALDAAGLARVRGDSLVLFSQNAAAGDPGSSLYPTQFFEFDRDDLARLTASEADYRAFLAERYNVRGQRRHRVATMRNLTFTTVAGVDGRALLPPTMRNWRNEDLLLGEAALFVHPHAVMYDFPWALPHLREPRKRWLPLDASEPFAQDPNHFLIEAIAEGAPHCLAAQPARRLAALAQLVGDLAALPDRALAERLEAHLLDMRSRIAFAIRGTLERNPTAPEYWRRDAQRFLDGPALRFDSASIARSVFPATELRPAMQGYADVLGTWPALWEWCAGRGDEFI